MPAANHRPALTAGDLNFAGPSLALKKKAVLLLLLLYGEQRSEVDGLEAPTGSDSASEGDNKSVKLNETRNFLDTGLLDLLSRLFTVFLE